jgi:hypothetical protein
MGLNTKHEQVGGSADASKTHKNLGQPEVSALTRAVRALGRLGICMGKHCVLGRFPGAWGGGRWQAKWRARFGTWQNHSSADSESRAFER